MDFFAAVTKDDVEFTESASITGLVRRDPFDVSQVSDLFGRFHGEIDGIKNTADSCIVRDDQSYAEAQEIVGMARKLRSAIDKKRKELKEPYLAFTRVLDGEANGLSARLDQIAKDVEAIKLLPFARMKEQQRREAEQKAREEAARRQAELDRQAAEEAARLAAEAKAKAEAEGKNKEQVELAEQQAAAMAEPAPVVVPDIPAETKLTTESATSKIEYDWAWDIVDFAAIPAEVWEERKEHVIKALAPAINARVKAGLRNLGGVKVYKIEKLKITTRR